jgi:hypothetical protein
VEVGGGGDDLKSRVVKKLMMSWVHKKVMSSEEVVANDGSRDGGKDEREVETMAAKLYWKALVAQGSDWLVIGNVEKGARWGKRGMMRNDTFRGTSINEETFGREGVSNEGEVVTGGDGVDAPPAN